MSNKENYLQIIEAYFLIVEGAIQILTCQIMCEGFSSDMLVESNWYFDIHICV